MRDVFCDRRADFTSEELGEDIVYRSTNSAQPVTCLIPFQGLNNHDVERDIYFVFYKTDCASLAGHFAIKALANSGASIVD